MRPYLLLATSLLPIACSMLDEDRKAGIMVTGTTITAQGDTLKIAHAQGIDTTRLYASARTAQIAPRIRPDNLALQDSGVQVAWDFASDPALGRQAQLGTGQYEIPENTPWADLAHGALRMDSLTASQFDLSTLGTVDTATWNAGFYVQGSTKGRRLLGDGQSFEISTDDQGVLSARAQDGAQVWQSQTSKLSLNQDQWHELHVELDQNRIILSLNRSQKDTLTLVLAQKRGSRWSWGQSAGHQGLSGWLDFVSCGQTKSGKTDTAQVDSTLLVDTRDGQSYQTIWIGGQRWMAQNLNYGAFTDASIGHLAQNAKYCPANDYSKCATMGALYAWNVAMDLHSSCDSMSCAAQIQSPNHRGICPAGWHVPTRAEWQNLATAIGGISQGNTLKSKTSGFAAWDNDNTAVSGFNALPTGYIWSKAAQNYGSDALFWAVDEVDSQGNAFGFALYTDNPTLTDNTGDWKVTGEALRCVKD